MKRGEANVRPSTPSSLCDESGASCVFVFNPFTEGYIARGKAFTPVKLQTMLAEDLANLPQFLCEPQDYVILEKRAKLLLNGEQRSSVSHRRINFQDIPNNSWILEKA